MNLVPLSTCKCGNNDTRNTTLCFTNRAPLALTKRLQIDIPCIFSVQVEKHPNVSFYQSQTFAKEMSRFLLESRRTTPCGFELISQASSR